MEKKYLAKFIMWDVDDDTQYFEFYVNGKEKAMLEFFNEKGTVFDLTFTEIRNTSIKDFS